MNFVIFLDIDGVLVSYNELKNYHIDQEHSFKINALDSLNAIISFYDADLCMISSWNTKFKNKKHYEDFLINRGVIVNNLTIGDHVNRINFIKKFIAENKITNYLIIDDESYEFFKSCITNNFPEYKRILQPNRYRCLDNFDVEHVTKNWNL